VSVASSIVKKKIKYARDLDGSDCAAHVVSPTMLWFQHIVRNHSQPLQSSSKKSAHQSTSWMSSVRVAIVRARLSQTLPAQSFGLKDKQTNKQTNKTKKRKHTKQKDVEN
jgi:hypothetical protein